MVINRPCRRAHRVVDGQITSHVKNSISVGSCNKITLFVQDMSLNWISYLPMKEGEKGGESSPSPQSVIYPFNPRQFRRIS